MSKIAIFVSGSGTNMENLLQRAAEGFFPGHEFALIVSDNPAAKAIERAKKFSLPVALVDRKKFEEVSRGNLSDLVVKFSKKKPLGEIVIVVSGKNRKKLYE